MNGLPGIGGFDPLQISNPDHFSRPPQKARDSRRAPQPEPGVQLTVDFSRGRLSMDLHRDAPSVSNTSAVVDVRIKGSTHSLRYEMPEEVRAELLSIRRYYSDRDNLSPRTSDNASPTARRASKTGERLVHQVMKLLRWQEFLRIATILHESAELTQGRSKVQDLVLEDLGKRYAESLALLSTVLRNQRSGASFVRNLLQSDDPTLIDLGTQVARDPSLRTALQTDLAEVYRSPTAWHETRQRAFALLRAAFDQLSVKLPGNSV